MVRISVVALLLVSGLTFDAAASERPGNASDNAKKIRAYLETVGFNNPRITQLSNVVNERVEQDENGRYLRLAEERFEHSRMVLHYEMKPKIGIRQMQLKYQPDNSHSEVAISTQGAIYSYRFHF